MRKAWCLLTIGGWWQCLPLLWLEENGHSYRSVLSKIEAMRHTPYAHGFGKKIKNNYKCKTTILHLFPNLVYSNQIEPNVLSKSYGFTNVCNNKLFVHFFLFYQFTLLITVTSTIRKKIDTSHTSNVSNPHSVFLISDITKL